MKQVFILINLAHSGVQILGVFSSHERIELFIAENDYEIIRDNLRALPYVVDSQEPSIIFGHAEYVSEFNDFIKNSKYRLSKQNS